MASFESARAESDNIVFELRGGREVVDVTRAITLLAESTHITAPKIIRLSNKSITADAAALIAERLSTFSDVHTVDISDIIAGRPEEEAIRVLKAICGALQLRPLISVNVSDNAFGLKGVDACRCILDRKQTEIFYFCNNGLSAEAAAEVANILLDGGVPPIKVFHFYNNMCGNGGAVAVARIVAQAEGLVDLRFSATRSSHAGCHAIAEVTISSTHKTIFFKWHLMFWFLSLFTVYVLSQRSC
jgi:Ran GTPase-activating protein 1